MAECGVCCREALSRVTVPKWAYKQPDLFNVEAAEAALTEAVERVERNAEAEWMDAALKAVKLVAEHRETFTSDAIWAVLARWGVEQPHEERALGAVLRKAKTLGWCVTTNQTSRSVRPICHRRDLRVWRSLIVLRNGTEHACNLHYYAPADGSCPYEHVDPDDA